jgi:hypothetical protein
LRRQAGRVRYQPGDRLWLQHCRGWFPAAGGARSSR